MALSKMEYIEYFFSDDSETDDMDFVSSEEETTSKETSRKRSRQDKGQSKRRTVRFMTSTGTQTEPFMMIGRTVCVTGPAVDQRLSNRQEVDGLNILVDRLRGQLSKRQNRIEQLERELVDREVETVACRMRALALRTQVEMNEQIVEEFAEKIKFVTEELSRERLERDNEDVTNTDNWEVD